MAVKIKLKRMGKIRAPYYRIVVADSRTKRDGRAIEEIGKYHPRDEPSLIQVDSERVQYWLSVGAQPTEAVAALLKVTGDWQRFTGQPGAGGTLKVAEPRPNKKAVFEQVARQAMGEPKEGATTSQARARPARTEESKGGPAPSDSAPGESSARRKPETQMGAGEAPAESTGA